MGTPRVVEVQGLRKFRKGKVGMVKAARRLWSSIAPDLPSLQARTQLGFGRTGNSQGVWAGGRARTGGRSSGRRRPARRAVRPAYLQRGGAGAGAAGGGGEVGAVSRSP